MHISYHDSHLHLTSHKLDENCAFIEGLKTLGFHSFGLNTAQLGEWQILHQLALAHKEIFPFFGIHPWHAEEVEDNWHDQLRSIVEQRGTGQRMGIGEIGLDKKCATSAVTQELVFIEQLKIAQHYKLPVTIHCLGRWGRMVEILEQLAPTIPLIFHAFNGSYEIMQRLLKHHSLFSFHYRALEKAPLKALLQKIPLQNILLETDLCHPVQKGAENKAHQNLIHLYREVAELRGMSLIEFAHQVEKNGEI